MSPMYYQSFSFLVSLLFFFGTTSARDRHFFSKITRDNTNADANPNVNEIKLGDIKVHDVQAPVNEESSLKKARVQVQVQGQEQEPSFIPQTNENGGYYGLYGHETGLLPPSTTTTTTTAASTATFNLPFNTDRNNERFYSMDTSEAQKLQEQDAGQDAYQLYSNAVYYNPEYEGLSGKEFVNNARLRNGEAYNYYLQQQRRQKQGMSDTRFLNNGKYYYYDPYSEENVVPSLGYSNYKNDNVNNGYVSDNVKVDTYFEKNVPTLGSPNYDNEKVNNVDDGYFGVDEKANAYQYNNGMQEHKNQAAREITPFGP